MTPEESEAIGLAGITFFQNMSNLILVTGLFGVYILASIISMHIILQKNNNGWAHKGLIALLLAGFAMTVLFTCADIAVNLLLVKLGLVEPLPGGPMAQEMTAELKAFVVDILVAWSGSFIILIADIAIVWRAWALWAEHRLIISTLLIFLLADIGIGIADSVVDSKALINSSGNNTATLDWLSTTLNLTVNIVATFLIAYRAWTHHRSTHTILRNKKTQVEAILVLMVESGAMFGVVQVATIIFNALDIQAADFSPVDDADFFLDSLYIYSAALNPVALVILIQTGNTYEHSFHLEDVTSLEINSVPNVN
ncbi:hypothetical protein BT96DRAFT_978377 [Gymnopus androsaceus JB14]|uniref:Uncharacterized protein n=1 Tax=Gymnopus androsaceus JB14 TaxID=1447944 RepID=A0A6A4HAB8_9AGAR|nr:hypothetical protein BT96DRAFT_978377 [Gymnopus androsaceus JB14]